VTGATVFDMSCSLDSDARREQFARFARVATSVVAVEREPRLVRFRLDESVDRDVLEELIAIESECCPFYEFDLSGDVLAIGVGTDEFAPALEAMVELLNPAAASRA
jgi:hypothetical protein